MPLKYANHVTGASYIISFGIGSALVTVAVLFVVNLTHLLRQRCATQKSVVAALTIPTDVDLQRRVLRGPAATVH